MPFPSLKRVYCAYVSDDGNTYQKGTSIDNATAGGGTPEAAGTHAPYPPGFQMRHIAGVNDAGKTTKIPIFSPTNELWTSAGGTFNKDGGTWKALARIGERREYRGGGPVPS